MGWTTFSAAAALCVAAFVQDEAQIAVLAEGYRAAKADLAFGSVAYDQFTGSAASRAELLENRARHLTTARCRWIFDRQRHAALLEVLYPESLTTQYLRSTEPGEWASPYESMVYYRSGNAVAVYLPRTRQLSVQTMPPSAALLRDPLQLGINGENDEFSPEHLLARAAKGADHFSAEIEAGQDAERPTAIRVLVRYTKLPFRRLWIAPDQGFFPIRVEVLGRSGKVETELVQRVERFGAKWFVRTAYVISHGTSGELGYRMIHVTKADFAEPPREADFAIACPEKTRVFDSLTRNTLARAKAGAFSFNPLTELKGAQNAPLSPPGPGPHVSPKIAARRQVTLIGWPTLAAGVCLVVLLIVWLWWRRSK